MSNNWYVDFMNPEWFVNKVLHSEGYQYVNFRNIKNIINTRISMFGYEGIDKEKFPMLTPAIIETALMFQTSLCFYEVPSLGGWFLLKYTSVGENNAYAKPTRVTLQTLNNVYIGEADYEDIILVRDNQLDILPLLPILEYMAKVDNIEQCMDKVLNNATLPLVLVGNKKQANALKQVAKSLSINSPYIVGDDTVIDQVKSFNINVPINPLDIYDLRRKYLNECMSSLGIYSVEEKRERIVTQELVNQNDYTDFIYMSALNERERFIKELNEKAGTNIKVIETYDLNYEDSVKEEAFKEKELAKATAKGEFEGNPKAFEQPKITGGNSNGNIQK